MKILLILVAFFMSGCAARHAIIRHNNCSVTKGGDRAVMTCPDGTSIVIEDGADGMPGQDGKDGMPGQDGKDGASCTVTQISNGALIQCGSSSAVVLNGADGKSVAYAVKEIIDPCGDDPKRPDELIARLESGQLLAHFSHGKGRFFTVLVPGNYQTTDGQKCRFTVHDDMSVSW